jgi:hypothetical protein
MKKGPFKMKGFSGFSNSPMKDDVYGAKTKFAKEEKERKSKIPNVENLIRKKSTSEIMDEASVEYNKKGAGSFNEIMKKANKKIAAANAFNTSRQNYLNKVSSVLPTAAQAAKSKGTLTKTPSLTTRLKNKLSNLFN